MAPVLFVWFSLSGWATGEQLPKLNEHATKLMIEKVVRSERSRDASRREVLEGYRNRRLHEEKQIEWLESIIKKGSASGYDLDIAKLLLKHQRDLVTDIKQFERQLWEQQPGGIEAPRPREKK